jgi:hypothetical protein
MKNYLWLALSMCVFHAQGQFTFYNATPDTCYDGITELNVFQNWQAYQTLDDMHDGVVDSTACIDITGLDWQATIAAAQMDINKPVFLRWSNPDGYLLESNRLYTISIWFANFWDLYTDPNGCEEDLCNGFIVKVRVPDNPNDLDTLPEYRIHKQEFIYGEWGNINICLPTENFEQENALVDLILKIQLQPAATEFIVYEPFLEYVWMHEDVIQASLPNYSNGPYEYYFWDYNNYLVRYEETSFPSLDSMSYLEVAPIPNTAEQSVVNLTLGQSASLNFQPFTGIRGALVEGDTTTRHYLNLINDGTICMNFFFELVLPPGDVYTHRLGHLESSWGSCVRFQPGATLRIADHAHLDFGQLGMGMLATQSGALIDLQHGAHMTLNCPWRMFNEPWQTNTQDVHVYLNEQNQLIFGPYASLENFSTNENMKLIIHMQGGYLDLGPLSENELQHIEIVYPPAMADLQWLRMESLVSDGQFVGACRVAQDIPYTIEIHDLGGRLLSHEEKVTVENYAQVQLQTSEWQRGMYVISIAQSGKRMSTKLLVQ